MQKCSFYLRGLHHFENITDHRPLFPISIHYTLDTVENPRLQRLKENFFHTSVQHPGELVTTSAYLMPFVRHGFPRNRYDLHSTLLLYWKLREYLYCDDNLVLYGPCVVISETLLKTAYASA